jgi:hypothetical protein
MNATLSWNLNSSGYPLRRFKDRQTDETVILIIQNNALIAHYIEYTLHILCV